MKAKKHTQLFAALLLISYLSSGIDALASPTSGNIQRLTYSGNNPALYPSLSGDGSLVLYILEIIEKESTTKSIRLLNTETGKELELFRGGEKKAPPPFDQFSMQVGTKPPQISGNGRVVIFSISIADPAGISDHFLGVIHSDGSNLQIYSFPILALDGRNLKKLNISSQNWERLANYAIDSRGNHVVCLVKGCFGPRQYGNPSGIISIDLGTKEQRTLMAPSFDGEKWIWPSFPKNPLTGGGWSFGLSGDGETIIFGAQTSDDRSDYDLYALDWEESDPVKLTDFHDRWFSLADINQNGQKIVFYYTGQKKQGIGTYVLDRGSGAAVHLASPSSGRIDFYDMSASGRYILFKKVYTGIIHDLLNGVEQTVFEKNTPGYVTGPVPMDFPRLPSFWCPQILSSEGDRILLTGFPAGKSTPELYMLYLDKRE